MNDGTIVDVNGPAHRILVVEDDVPLAAMVAEFLTLHGFVVSVESRGDVAVARAAQEQPDAMVLDINLPGLDGYAVCRRIRQDYRGPIIMLTACGEESDEVLGLEAGADDYMAKPVRPRALLTRLRCHLRRASPGEPLSAPIRIGDLVVDAGRRIAELNGQTVDLTSGEFDLLHLLAQYAGRAMSRQELHQRLHGMHFDVLDRSIDLRISRLRRKLGDDPVRPQRVKSIRNIGYMLAVES